MPDLQDEAGTPLTPSATTSSAPTLGRRSVFAVLGGCAASALLADQSTKIWALAALTPTEPVEVVGSLLRLNLVRNPGAAFSIGDGATWVLTVVSLVIIVWVAIIARTVGTRSWAVGLGLLLGGAVGNLIDRIFRAPGPGRGHVIDFIDYSGWFIGNVADIAIVGAAGLIVLLSWRGIPVSGGVPANQPAHGAGERAHD
ncbi:MAG: signal peptidase II [Dermatophilaceae bacterium]